MKNNSSISKFLDLLKRDESEPDFKQTSHPSSDSSHSLTIIDHYNKTSFHTRRHLYRYRINLENERYPPHSYMIPED